MLYDPKWENRAKPSNQEMWSLDRFTAWLESKPPKESFRFTDPWDCALAQYFKAHGFADADADIWVHGIPKSWRWLVNCHGYETFGYCLRRLRWLRANRLERFKMWITGQAPESWERIGCPNTATI